jgi:predicted RNase H-like nuclease (RuvC/YqgF family)
MDEQNLPAVEITMNKPRKLDKVLTFYQQQLELIKTKFKEQANIVAAKEILAKQLQRRLTATQERSAAAEPTAWTLEMSACLMERIEIDIRQNQNQLTEETRILETRRLELRTQMSKIEALEKVVANKTKTIEHLKRQTEQHLADERYLNTHFNGSIK